MQVNNEEGSGKPIQTIELKEKVPDQNNKSKSKFMFTEEKTSKY